MAAYAALVSLEHIIHNLHHHSRPPITLHKEQARLLTQNLTFLQQFLQLYNPNLNYSKEADPLESRIACAAYAAEDAIESHIFDRLTNNDGEKMSSGGLYGALEKVIEDMALMEKEAMEIKENGGFKNQLADTESMPPAHSSRSSFSSSSIAHKKSKMVGADDLLLEMKSNLTGRARDLQTIPIVGMGGSGKTTLALNIYHEGLIEESFDIRAWATISQEYSVREVLVQLLTQLIEKPKENMSEGELGEMLHKHLFGRKYMIILDDVWSLKAWDGVKRFLPNTKNGSRIVITTRLTTLASALPNSNSLEMKLLDEDNSWDLLSKTVFGEKGCCPPEFKDIGKKIGRSCKGLPLSILVVGGLLAKSEGKIEYWENMEGNLNEIVNLEDDERCLKVLYMSYKQLPVHLKPCFLYMGIYGEDHEICISKLIRLWVAEGFLKPISGKRLEDVARMYLMDLIDRNLILVHRVGSIGSIKECKVHDLLRDLCMREAKKQGLYTVCSGQEIKDRMNRIVISSTEEVHASSFASPPARSLILDHSYRDVPPHIFRSMRTVDCSYIGSNEFVNNVHQLVNLRFLKFILQYGYEFPRLIWLFWNLHTLVVDQNYLTINAPDDIWYMSRIRHLYFDYFHLPPDLPSNVLADGIVLENLQTLGCIKNFTCSEQVVERIPNIRKLKIWYNEGADDRFCLSNLDRLEKLESLNCIINRSMMCRINYPRSLKKLSLVVDKSQCWGDLLDEIGDLPLLQKLKLCYGSFEEGQWETTEGRFRSLKFLSLQKCEGLQVWTLEASHFPRLEQLRLCDVFDLEEIPSDFTDVSTLRLIHLDFCCDSAIESASRILEEQEELYGKEDTTLQVQVHLWRKNDPALKKRLGNPNFTFLKDRERIT